MNRVMHLNSSTLSFAVVGDAGAIHFWVDTEDVSSEHTEEPGYVMCGIEQHSRKPMYASQAEPTHDPCWILKGPCYHDGGTGPARDYLLPMFIDCNRLGDFEPLWLKIEQWYRERFGDEE